jgi:hypothetical protein
MRLFSYCIPYDDGAAPNPFWGVCTLAICKPAVRRVAQVGDWLVGTGSKQSPIGDISGQVVYAMRVTEKLSMEDYDAFTRAQLSEKRPVKHSRDRRRACGDSIYDFSLPGAPQRPGVHDEGNRMTDLAGRFVLLSTHFYYFGDQPVPLPAHVIPIVRQGQGHRSSANDPWAPGFVGWIDGLGIPPRSVIGQPQFWRRGPDDDVCGPCAAGRRNEGEDDLKEVDC